MTHAESRSVSYAIAGSLAVHGLLVVALALWASLSSFQRIHVPKVQEEPEVTLIFPKVVTPAPALPTVPQKDERYVRTTQNTEAPAAPAKPDFVSDKNTVASAKLAPAPDGDKAMPNTKGVDYPTLEMANRTYKDGQIKNDSAPSPPKPAPAPVAPQPPVPQMKPPEPTPQPQIAKKEDSPAEKMMKELDAKLEQDALKPKPPEKAKPEETRDALPAMRTPDEMSVPRAIPVAEPIANTPRPEKDAFQPETRTAAVKGTLSNVTGENALSAAATPVGRYMRQVTSAIEKKWHYFRRLHADVVEPGKMGLRFYVNKNGKVEDIQFLFKESNALMEDFTIEAILKAEIPPIPKDLLLILDKERVEINYDIVIHP